MIKFRALMTFGAKRGKGSSHYCKGLTYTVRKGNTPLLQRLDQWLVDGKVELVSGPGVTGIIGRGQIK